MKIGWIGLGHIGGVMAANLMKAGYRLAVHDLEYEAAENLIKAGAEWAATPQALAMLSTRLGSTRSSIGIGRHLFAARPATWSALLCCDAKVPT